ncbi:GtrA family protein [Conservatibacter flavescens]|uniref:GtrA family protein n=1 Tax=Conservatibacter flavescens TaxID=28161 RepID=A0A2M8RZU0_9PAST|nr:GtrA family protein [Conservatibacter flavescens]PJG84405.1 GtrA family protein [Conservatibacter flavescens]
MNKSTIKQILFFGFIGGVGFVVDTTILYLLKDNFGLYISRLVSFICAVFVTWILNRNITFKAQRRTNKFYEFLYYLWCMIFGGMANLLTYYLLVSYVITVLNYPIVGVAAGSIAGMVINFISSKFLVFNNEKT